MKLPTRAIMAALYLIAPLSVHAQSDQPLTRAQVRAELVQIESSGYRPSSDWVRYPENFAAAEANVAARKIAEEDEAAASGYGSAMSGSARQGSTVISSSQPAILSGH